MRRYPMSEVGNMRDLGGYPVPGGHFTRYGQFIRSDVPLGLYAHELDYLRDEVKLTTVADLRDDGERALEPTDLAGLPWLTCFHFPLDKGISWPHGEEDYGRCYLEIAEGPLVARLMRTLLQAPGAALFHCSAGKDRTGITAALLLGLAGVSDADIVADYQVSYSYIYDKVLRMREDNPVLPAHIGQSKPEYMWDFLDRLQQCYGGAEGLLKQAGLADAELAQLRAKLID